MSWGWDSGGQDWGFAVLLLLVFLLARPVAGIAVAAGVGAVAAAAAGEVVGIRKSVFIGAGVGVALDVLVLIVSIAAATGDTGYGFSLYVGYNDVAGYPAHYDFTVPLASALAFYTAPAVIAAAVIRVMARRTGAGFHTLRDSLLVGGGGGIILLAVGTVVNAVAGFFAPFIVAIGVVVTAVFAVRIIRARRARGGDGGGR